MTIESPRLKTLTTLFVVACMLYNLLWTVLTVGGAVWLVTYRGCRGGYSAASPSLPRRLLLQ